MELQNFLEKLIMASEVEKKCSQSLMVEAGKCWHGLRRAMSAIARETYLHHLILKAIIEGIKEMEERFTLARGPEPPRRLEERIKDIMHYLEVLKDYVNIEASMADLYSNLSKKAPNNALSLVLRALSENEVIHKETIQTFIRDLEKSLNK